MIAQLVEQLLTRHQPEFNLQYPIWFHKPAGSDF